MGFRQSVRVLTDQGITELSEDFMIGYRTVAAKASYLLLLMQR